jgi:peptide-methionine (S)-S-oxide reductase
VSVAVLLGLAASKPGVAQPFYRAEAYHQDFLVRHPENPYIVVNDLPKVRALQMTFPKSYRSVPVTVRPVS